MSVRQKQPVFFDEEVEIHSEEKPYSSFLNVANARREECMAVAFSPASRLPLTLTG